MQNKGFVSVFAALLALVCAFYISFSIVTIKHENLAKEYAEMTGKPENEKYYLDSISTEEVWLGYTYKQAQEMQIGLGLDLKGGMNVILEINVADVLTSLAAENGGNPVFVEAIAKTKEGGANSGDEFLASFAENYKKVDPTAKLSDVFSTYQLKDKIKKDTPDSEVLSILQDEMEAALSNSFQVLRNRIDRFGVIAPNIQRLEQAGRILIELPGVKEPERVKNLLQGSANLEFWETYNLAEIYQSLVEADQALASLHTNDSVVIKYNELIAQLSDSTLAPMDSLEIVGKLQGMQANVASLVNPLLSRLQLYVDPQRGPIEGPIVGIALSNDMNTINELLASKQVRDRLPRKLKFAWAVKASDKKGTSYELYALKAHDNAGHPALPNTKDGGDIVVDARADFQQFNGSQYEVSMEMTPEAAKDWATLTKSNVGKCIAIVLDDVVYSAPRVNGEITGGRSSITGNFDAEEANDLANVLKSGKMAAKVNIVSEDVVGPTLGQEAITASVVSFFVAILLLFSYMMLIYGFRVGLVADICLLINAFFTIGILSSFGAVLTLSGIAGLVLSMGIAVDANVLIYERAKEELAAGKGIRSAVSAAYSNAFSAIFDANLTSLITGIILYVFGTGPIRGFAVTFIVGIITSFISAVFLSRIFIEGALAKGMWTSISFRGLCAGIFKPWHVDFIAKSGRSRIIYIVASLICIGAMVRPGGLNMGIEFTGGSNYIISFNDVEAVDEIRLTETMKPYFGDATVSTIQVGNDAKLVRISTNYNVNNTDPQGDLKVKQFILDAAKSLNYVPEHVTIEQFDQETYIQSTQKVGPSIADDVTVGAIWAVIVSLIAIALYILIRFRNVAFSIGSIIGLAANTLFVIGFYAIFWEWNTWFSMEVDQSFIAAILTVIGYSINDIVVVFDRIREVRTLYPNKDLKVCINEAINMTMPRTLNTSITTFIVLIIIFFLGGATIQSFICAMILGVVIDPITTIYLAVPTAYAFMKKKEAKPAKKYVK